MDRMQYLDKTHIRLLSLDVMMTTVVHAGVQLEDKKVTAITVEQQTLAASKALDMHGSMYANRTILVSRQQTIAYVYVTRQVILTSLILRTYSSNILAGNCFKVEQLKVFGVLHELIRNHCM